MFFEFFVFFLFVKREFFQRLVLPYGVNVCRRRHNRITARLFGISPCALFANQHTCRVVTAGAEGISLRYLRKRRPVDRLGEKNSFPSESRAGKKTISTVRIGFFSPPSTPRRNDVMCFRHWRRAQVNRARP